ncbi:SHOCT domain-containing protein [uncultured Tateyamaria sp.]|uniref:SHOCT domain-containing protein n=1 Tax=uncultured Tateyamaria sp. TaxID=455651 RepID=UPI002620A227|nr:SHOCT domain-containing protein [uncultured Tateyamaria sp.]
MTAILDDMRRLDAAHARGEITAVDLAAAKAKLLDSVPDASEASRSAAPARRARRATIWPMLLLCVMVVTICAGAALVLTGDLMLSATLAITVLAAITIMLFRQLDG